MSNLQRYTLFGVAFGSCFPLMSIPLDMLLFKALPFALENILTVHLLNPLHFVIDTAPLFLGIAFGVAGKKQDNATAYHAALQNTSHQLIESLQANKELILSQNAVLEDTVTIRTAQLSEANEELKQIVEELHTTIEVVNQQKEDIDNKNKNITASIRYALTIQQSILPTEQLLNTVFVDYFILYRPKDIVSGDFYFCHYHAQQRCTFVSVVDCTGHGVPGAFMSILVHNLLQEAIEVREIESPAAIFNYITQALVKFLKKHNPESTDGFDAILCKIEPNNNITFVSTKLPMYVYYQDSHRILTYYGDVVYVGVEDKNTVSLFSEQSIRLQQGDGIYLASDGIIDQPNSERKRFGSKRFVQLLEHSANQTMPQQLAVLEQTLENFSFNTAQRDDITVLGIKIC